MIASTALLVGAWLMAWGTPAGRAPDGPLLDLGAALAHPSDAAPPVERRIDLEAGRWRLRAESELAWASYRSSRWEIGLVLDNLFGTSEPRRAFDDPAHPGLPFEKPPPVEGDRFAPGQADLRVFATLFF